MTARSAAVRRDAPPAAVPQAPQPGFDIVLQPIAHPALGEICIGDELFAVGRTEPPFGAYSPDLVAGLSRRHARIFSEGGAVYVADLGSKNGTAVNDLKVRERPARLRDGDQISFGPDLAYRVHFRARAEAPARTAKLVGLTLCPVGKESGLQPIVISQFPFLIGKADDTFSRYQDQHPHQVSYISRRHAHVFVKGATPYLEDLGSTNGTFVGGQRLDEHAVALDDGVLVGLGGSHFVYKVKLDTVLESDATETNAPAAAAAVAPAAAAAVPAAVECGDPERTTFVVSPASFLDIFCVDHVLEADAPAEEPLAKQVEDAKPPAARSRERTRAAIFSAALTSAFGSGERTGKPRVLVWVAAVVAGLAIVAAGLYLWGASEREVKDLFASGEYARAATMANQYLGRNPDNAEIQALATDALLKANVPDWLTLLKAGDFERADAVLAAMKQLASHNSDAQSLVAELAWLGDLERFVVRRGGIDAPVRMYADEEAIRKVLRQWNQDTQRHQRAFATISSYVPEFRDGYAEALSHLRKLQNDDSVYLGAIERLKGIITTELQRDTPQALTAVLREYAEKYPRLGGLDAVRRDLRQYVEVENEARARRLGRLIGLAARVRFSTPPFQAKFRTLASSDRFPPADLVQSYGAVAKAWREGDTKQAFASLQALNAGPWADAAANELVRKRAIAEQYAALQRVRGTAEYEERLLAFHGALDPDEDAYFVRAIAADVAAYTDKALARAQASRERAESLWRQYRENGAIEGRQRLTAAVSNEFRTQAQLLAEANENAQRGLRIHAQLRIEPPGEWAKVEDEIKAEAELQKKSLLDLRNILEPGVLKAKLALLEGRNDDGRKAP
jgi:pSer/pThr/pTyr-binding forkhead associated (FHA) protein